MASAMPFGRYQIILLVTEAHVCEQLAHDRYMEVKQPGVEPTTC